MKRIAFLIPTLDLGGAERQLLNTVNSLITKDLTIKVFVLKNRICIANQLNENIEIEIIGLSKYYNLSDLNKCFSSIQNFKPDILHSVMYTSNILSRLFKVFNPKVKIVNHIHGLGSWKKKYHIYIDRLLSPYVDKFLVVSEMSRNIRLNREKYPESKVQLLYNSIDTNKFVVSEKEPLEFITFGTASRLIELKQVDKTIELIYYLKKRGVKAKLFIAGEGPLRDDLENLVKEKQLESDVIFEGKLDEMQPFYKKIDCLLLFSRTEDLPMVIIEAFASGTSVISTDVGGVSELINGNIGLLIEHQIAIESQMDAIVDFIEKLHLKNAWKINSNFAIKNFDNHVHIEKLIKIYENL